MPLMWSYFGDDTKDLMLIAVQSVSSDKLTYPGNDEAGKFTYLNPLSPSTPLTKIAFYDEVKNPKATENVVGVLRKKEFRAVLQSLSGSDFSTADLISSVSNHPECISP